MMTSSTTSIRYSIIGGLAFIILSLPLLLGHINTGFHGNLYDYIYTIINIIPIFLFVFTDLIKKITQSIWDDPSAGQSQAIFIILATPFWMLIFFFIGFIRDKIR